MPANPRPNRATRRGGTQPAETRYPVPKHGGSAAPAPRQWAMRRR